MKPLDPRLLRHTAGATGRYLAACVGLGVVGALLLVVQAALLGYAVTAVFQHGADLSRLRGVLAALVGVVAGRAVLGWAQEVAAHRAAASVRTELRGRLLAHVARLGPGWLAGRRSGELATLVTSGLDALDAYFARYLPQLLLAAIVPVTVLGFVMPTDTLSGVTILVTLPLVPVFMILIGTTTQRRTERQYRLLARLSHHFLDVVAGLATLKAFGRARAQRDTIRAVTGEYRRVTLRTLRLAFLSALALELIATISVALVAVGIGLRLVDGSLDLRTGLTVLILAPEAYLPLRRLGANYHASAAGLAAAGEVFTVLETPVPVAGTRTDLPGATGAPLRVRGLTVRYPDRATPALREVSLTVRPGEIVALTGPNGSGKSTLLAAVLGLVTPESGLVSLGEGAGEVALPDADPAAWRRRFAWVPQRPHLFAATVTANIRLGDPAATAEAVRRAADQAGATGFIDALPDGFDTVLGENGAGLSAGQRQRIALARAFLRGAPIVLLDEPTANLDAEVEAEIIAAVRRLARGRSVLLVAHRPELLRLADRVITLTPPVAGPAAAAGAAPAAAPALPRGPLPATGASHLPAGTP